MKPKIINNDVCVREILGYYTTTAKCKEKKLLKTNYKYLFTVK